VTDDNRSSDGSPLDRRSRSIRVTDPSHGTAAGRRTGGIETVSSGVETVSTSVETVPSGVDSRVTVGLSTGRKSFTGLLGFGFARYGSPVTLTFRQPRVDGETDTPFDSPPDEPRVDGPPSDTRFDNPPDGSPHTAVSTADHDRSAFATTRERPSLVADRTASTVHCSPHHAPQPGAHQSMARLQGSTTPPRQSNAGPQQTAAGLRQSTTRPETAPDGTPESHHPTARHERPRASDGMETRDPAHRSTETHDPIPHSTDTSSPTRPSIYKSHPRRASSR
jgi:hypothetical protein